MSKQLRACRRCVYDTRIKSIEFDEDGVCNFCHQIEDLKELYGTGAKKGKDKFNQIVDKIKYEGRGKKYDVIVGVSGGTDSSFMLYLAVKLGLRPLAVHYDNTWNTAIASQNIHKMVKSLNVDLVTLVVNNKEIDDIYRSFFYAGVAELDCSTDLAFAELLNRTASRFNIKHVFEGHSFICEGMSPLSEFYFDGKYISSIHKMYGELPMKTYPLMNFTRFLKSSLITRIKKIRPYWYIDYTKEHAQQFLSKNFDWKYYGGHHLENRMAAFTHSVLMPQKFKQDFRSIILSAQVRAGIKTRSEALLELSEPPYIETDLINVEINK